MPQKLPVRLRDVPACPEGREFLVIVAHGWARDTDLMKAARAACANGYYGMDSKPTTPAQGPMSIHAVTPDTRVNGMGALAWKPVWDENDPDIDHAEPIELASFETPTH